VFLGSTAMTQESPQAKDSFVVSANKAAIEIIMRYNANPRKWSEHIATHYNSSNNNREEKRVCQFIFLAYLRNKLLIECALKKFLKHKTRPKIYAFLQSAIAELIDDKDNKSAKVVHNKVDLAKIFFSKNEASFVNGVLRNFLRFFESLKENAHTPIDFGLLYSNPEFLTERWIQSFGEEKTKEILKSNNESKKVFFRISQNSLAQEKVKNVLEHLEKTNYENFYAMHSGAFSHLEFLLEEKLAYIQDPSTSFASLALAPKKGECILDLCAAPGGKSSFIYDLLSQQNAGEETTLVSVDVEGERFETLCSNLKYSTKINLQQVSCDVFKEGLAQKLKSKNLPEKFDAILLDAPCSNTGVLGRRPDARYRITKDDISNCASIQKSMLEIAVGLLKDKGRIVFSTCSIEEEENLQNAKYIVEKFPFMKLVKSEIIMPSAESDGAGLSVLEKS